MKEVTNSLVEKSKMVLNQPETIQDFNEFCIEYYKLTKHLLSSFNAFLKANDIHTTKLTQIKNLGEFLESSKDSIKVHEFLEERGYEEIPELNPKIAYYTHKKNKFSLIENWENILKVLEGKQPATFVLEETRLTDKQKRQVFSKVRDKLDLELEELEIIKRTHKELSSQDEELYKLFLASLEN